MKEMLLLAAQALGIDVGRLWDDVVSGKLDTAASDDPEVVLPYLSIEERAKAKAVEPEEEVKSK